MAMWDIAQHSAFCKIISALNIFVLSWLMLRIYWIENSYGEILGVGLMFPVLPFIGYERKISPRVYKLAELWFTQPVRNRNGH